MTRKRAGGPDFSWLARSLHSRRLADGESDRIVDRGVLKWGLDACAEALASEADRAAWPESVSWEGRCARCHGLGRFGVEQVSRRASVQWERKPAECLDPDGCGWPHDPDT